MTVYEYLGIQEYLINEIIPKEDILDSLDDIGKKQEAEDAFRDISHIFLRASLCRFGCYLQVVEIELTDVDCLYEISYFVQRAIKYQVLFVFNYEGRYLLARRSLEITKSTEHVYTENVSFCTNWIYEESLEDEFSAEIVC